MRRNSTRQLARYGALAAVFAAAYAPTLDNAKASDSAAAFYSGKTITFVIAAPPGGGYDLSARLLVRYLGQHVPGQPSVVPQNMPGAGGFRVANYLASAAPRDGLAIGMHTRGIIQAPMLGDPAARFDSADFSWIGTVSSSKDDAYLLVINKNSGIRSIDDMRRPGSPITLGSVGGITTNVVFALLSPQIFGFNTRLINGYDGSSSVMLALVRGEVTAPTSAFPHSPGPMATPSLKATSFPSCSLHAQHLTRDFRPFRCRRIACNHPTTNRFSHSSSRYSVSPSRSPAHQRCLRTGWRLCVPGLSKQLQTKAILMRLPSWA